MYLTALNGAEYTNITLETVDPEGYWLGPAFEDEDHIAIRVKEDDIILCFIPLPWLAEGDDERSAEDDCGCGCLDFCPHGNL